MTQRSSKNKKRSSPAPSAAPVVDSTLVNETWRKIRRDWFSSSGIAPDQMARPLIGVVVSSAQLFGMTPELQNLLENIDRGIQQAGGLPCRFALSSLAESLAEGHDGQSYLYPRRSILADEVECLAKGADLKGLVLAADQNDAAAGLISGATRTGLPFLFVPLRGSLGAPDAPAADVSDSLAHVADALVKSLRRPDTKSAFSTNGHVTARDDYYQNAIACLAEIMGLAAPHSSTVATGSAEQMRLAQDAGQRVVEMVGQSFDVRRFLLPSAFMNGARMDAAFGGWPDAGAFLLSLAQDLGVKFYLDHVAEAGQKTPQIASLDGKEFGLRHLHAAGGLPAVLRALKGHWQPHPLLNGRSMNDLVKSAPSKDAPVIKSKTPIRKEGGLVVLKGNFAPQGAFFQVPASFPAKTKVFSGPARVFDSREQALDALLNKQIKKGDVLVVRYEGPRGGQGFRPLALIGHVLSSLGLADSVAFVTDGRLGTAIPEGLIVQMASPEAAAGSAFSVIRDGEQIDIDLVGRRLMAHLTDTDLKVRLARWQAPPPRLRSPFLTRQARTAGALFQAAPFK